MPIAPPSSASSPSTPQSHSPLHSGTGSNVPGSAQMSEREGRSFQGDDDGASSQSLGGASAQSGGHETEHAADRPTDRAAGEFLSSPPPPSPSSSSNGTSQQKVPSPTLTTQQQQQSRAELELELARVRDRRAAIDRSLEGGREEGLESSPAPPPPPPPPPLQRPTRTRMRPKKFFGKEWLNEIHSF